MRLFHNLNCKLKVNGEINKIKCKMRTLTLNIIMILLLKKVGGNLASILVSVCSGVYLSKVEMAQGCLNCSILV